MVAEEVFSAVGLNYHLVSINQALLLKFRQMTV